MNNVRYRLTGDTRYIYQNVPKFPKLISNESDTMIKIDVFHRNGIYFLDILGEGTNTALQSVRVFAPNGEIILGEVLKDYITLHNKEELFDGRFNSDKVQ